MNKPASPAEPESADVKDAESSTAEDVNSQSSSSEDKQDVEQPSSLDIVNDVLDVRETQDSSPETGQEAEGTEDAEATAEDESSDEKTEDESKDVESKDEPEVEVTDSDDQDDEPVSADEDLPFGKHPRFKKLLSERDDWRAKAEDAAPAADQYRQVEQFITANHLTADDTADALALAAQFKAVQLGKADPAQVLKAFDTYRSQLASLTGDVLPPDLQEQVDTGEISPEVAQRIAKAEASSSLGQSALDSQRTLSEAEQKAAAQKQQADNRTRLIDDSRKAVAAVETSIRKSDPDYDVKESLVHGEMLRLAQTNGRPTTAEESAKIMRDAYANVNKVFQKTKPKPNTPKVPSSDKPSASTEKEPESTLDVIDQQLKRSRSVAG